jgi:hypothetical protein
MAGVVFDNSALLAWSVRNHAQWPSLILPTWMLSPPSRAPAAFAAPQLCAEFLLQR